MPPPAPGLTHIHAPLLSCTSPAALLARAAAGLRRGGADQGRAHVVPFCKLHALTGERPWQLRGGGERVQGYVRVII